MPQPTHTENRLVVRHPVYSRILSFLTFPTDFARTSKSPTPDFDEYHLCLFHIQVFNEGFECPLPLFALLSRSTPVQLLFSNSVLGCLGGGE